jgi:hypothetical protein
MSDEAGTWLRYAEENLWSARLLLEHGLLNPCLQNAQQAVEKGVCPTFYTWRFCQDCTARYANDALCTRDVKPAF